MKIKQHPSGTTAQNSAYRGPIGQITVDTERWELRLHDGVTMGGQRILSLTQLLLNFMSRDSEFGQVAFAPDGRGILTRTGDRTYNLRKMVNGKGVTITNPFGTDGDFTFAINVDELQELMFDNLAGRVPYALTTGVEGNTDSEEIAFSVTFPTGFQGGKAGAIGAVKFHKDGKESATLSINGGSPLAIRAANGSTKTQQVIRAGTVALILRGDNYYYMIGHMTAEAIRIAPIEGLGALNVQSALAELRAIIAAMGTPEHEAGTPSLAQNWYIQYGTPVKVASSGSYDMPLKNNETCGIAMASGGMNPAVKLNGVTLNSSSGASMTSAMGLVTRIEDSIYYTTVSSNIFTGTGNLVSVSGINPSQYRTRSTLTKYGSKLASNVDKVKLDIGSSEAGTGYGIYVGALGIVLSLTTELPSA